MWLCHLERPTAPDTFVHGRTSNSHPSYSTSKGPSNSMLSSVPMLTMVWGARTQTYAQTMIDWLYVVGHATGTVFNRPKTRGPATRLVILELLYCSVTRSCRVGDKKRAKYSARIDHLLQNSTTSSKILEQIVGNLRYAAWVEPFGRALLTFLANHNNTKFPHSPVAISP